MCTFFQLLLNICVTTEHYQPWAKLRGHPGLRWKENPVWLVLKQYNSKQRLVTSISLISKLFYNISKTLGRYKRWESKSFGFVQLSTVSDRQSKAISMFVHGCSNNVCAWDFCSSGQEAEWELKLCSDLYSKVYIPSSVPWCLSLTRWWNFWELGAHLYHLWLPCHPYYWISSIIRAQ